MPSPRPSPALRPASPLSPRFDQAARFDTIQALSPRVALGRQGYTQRRANPNSLKLPSLPRFHPANFPCHNSSMQGTSKGISPAQTPVSPGTQRRIYSEAQRQLYLYQRETLAAATRGTSPRKQHGNPISPRLVPLGSPGPVTPLDLEGQDGYLMAGARSRGQDASVSEELVEKLIWDEALRRRSVEETSGNGRPVNR